MARRDGTTKETLGQQTGANGDDFGLCQGAGNLDISQTRGGGGESNAGELYLTLDVVIFFSCLVCQMLTFYAPNVCWLC